MINKGDTIGIIALSGNCNKERIQKAKNFLEKSGYKVKLSSNIYNSERYLAGKDSDKIKELHKFFLDQEIKLILCARGGFGAIRLINKINYKIIESNPKPFCGFSDITALLLMIYKKTGLITYHSPMASSDFGVEDISNFTVKNFFSCINSDNQILHKGKKIYREGEAQGIIWGGNLATAVSLCGQNFIPNKNFIFFTEDLNEPVYKIDKMFQQLININKFRRNCKGIILGDFLDTDNKFWLEEYFTELSSTLKIPVISGFKITHGKDKITIPIGKMAEISGKNLYIN